MKKNKDAKNWKRRIKEFHFNITLIGEGRSEQAAWEDVCQGFIDNEHHLDKDDIISVTIQEREEED